MNHKLTKKTRKFHKKRDDGVVYLQSPRSAFFLYEKEKIYQGKSFVTLQKYTEIVTLFFILLFRDMLNKGETIHMPHNLGVLYIKAYKDNLSSPDKSINWDLTKKLGKVVGYTNSHSYRWSYSVHWDISNCKFYNKKFYTFKAARSEAARKAGTGKLAIRDVIFRAAEDPKTNSIFRR